MLEPGMRLFVVQCRPKGGQATTLYVPALNRDEAILRAKATAREINEHSPETVDPFESTVRLEVRVGIFDPAGSKIVFGNWIYLDH